MYFCVVVFLLFSVACADWQLVMKLSSGPDLGFCSPFWTDERLRHEDTPASQPINAKYAAFLTASFGAIKMCIGSPLGNCVTHDFNCAWQSARQLFSDGFIRDVAVNQTDFLKAFAAPAGKYAECPMQMPGFNVVCKDGNKARWGYCANCASQDCQKGDDADADATIGIGLAGQGMSQEMGAGWTAMFAQGAETCDATDMGTSKNVWLYVQKESFRHSRKCMPTPYQPIPSKSELDGLGTLVMKVSYGPELGFSSPYWTNFALLNEGSLDKEPQNAKYLAFLETSFNRITMCIDSPTGNCVTHTFGCMWTSARQLFSNGYIRDPNVDQAGILKAFAPREGDYRQCPMQRPGFNIQCKDGNMARWGYCANCATQDCQSRDDQDADAAIGIGLAGQAMCQEMGAGWTNYFASGRGTCLPNSMTSKNVWLYVSTTVGASFLEMKCTDTLRMPPEPRPSRAGVSVPAFVAGLAVTAICCFVTGGISFVLMYRYSKRTPPIATSIPPNLQLASDIDLAATVVGVPMPGVNMETAVQGTGGSAAAWSDSNPVAVTAPPKV